MELIHCTLKSHGPAILEILNEAIENSTAIFDYEPRAMESLSGWFAAKETGNFPVLGIVSPIGELLGFASYGPFRAWPAYKYTVEHSVYVKKDHRGRGIGRALMLQLIQSAQMQQYHVMVGGIELSNCGSSALHEALGFVHAGTIKQVAFKFGRWLDLGFYQLVLETPDNPVDG
jgi:phosphinothricin acetyltransferase